MELTVTQTPKGIKEFPLHKHETAEVMLYLRGEGNLVTERGNVPFSAGTAIVVPAGIKHGSKSVGGFENVCVYVPVKCRLNSFAASEELKRLVLLTRDLYFGGKTRAAEFVAEAVVELAVSPSAEEDETEKIRRAIGEKFTDPDFALTSEIAKMGYSVDRFRVIYRNRYGETPAKTLAKTRLSYARKLFDCYGEAISVSECAYRCGFGDALYFSKKFRTEFGVSPREYAAKGRKNDKQTD